MYNKGNTMFKKACLLICLLLVNQASSNQDSSLSCLDWRGNHIPDGTRFVPNKDDPCKTCACENGYEVRCMAATCHPPSCAMYETVEGECCQFNCITLPLDTPKNINDGAKNATTDPPIAAADTSNLGLRLVAGFLTILLTLALVMFLIHRLRRRRLLTIMRRGEAERQLEEEESGNYLPDIDEMDSGMDCPPYEEPPPPYTFTKSPTEAPPPYETLPRGMSGESMNGTATQSRGRGHTVISPDSTVNSVNARDSIVTTDTFISTLCGENRDSSELLASNQTLDIGETCEQHSNTDAPSCSYLHSSTLPAVRKKTVTLVNNGNTSKVKQDKRRRNSSPLQFLLENEQVMNHSANNSPTQRQRSSARRNKTVSEQFLDSSSAVDSIDHTRTAANVQPVISKHKDLIQGSEVQTEVAHCEGKNTVRVKNKTQVTGSNTSTPKLKGKAGSSVILQEGPEKVVVWSTQNSTDSPRHSYADRYSRQELEDLQRVGQYYKPGTDKLCRVTGNDVVNSQNHAGINGEIDDNVTSCQDRPIQSQSIVNRSDSVVSQMSAISINPETGEHRLKNKPEMNNHGDSSSNCAKEADRGDNLVDSNDLPVGGAIVCETSASLVPETQTMGDGKTRDKSYRRYIETEPSYQRLGMDTSPERRSRPHKRPNTVYKQYGFVDDLEVLSEQDPGFVNVLYTPEPDQHRSRSHERRSHKSRDRGASGERSRSGSRHRGRSGSGERSKLKRDRSRERAQLHKQEKLARNTNRKKRHTMDDSQMNSVVVNGHVNALGTVDDFALKNHSMAKQSKQRKSVPNNASNFPAEVNPKKGGKGKNKNSLKTSTDTAAASANGGVVPGKSETRNGLVNHSTSDNNINKIRVKKKHRNSMDVSAGSLPTQSIYL